MVEFGALPVRLTVAPRLAFLDFDLAPNETRNWFSTASVNKLVSLTWVLVGAEFLEIYIRPTLQRCMPIKPTISSSVLTLVTRPSAHAHTTCRIGLLNVMVPCVAAVQFNFTSVNIITCDHSLPGLLRSWTLYNGIRPAEFIASEYERLILMAKSYAAENWLQSWQIGFEVTTAPSTLQE